MEGYFSSLSVIVIMLSPCSPSVALEPPSEEEIDWSSYMIDWGHVEKFLKPSPPPHDPGFLSPSLIFSSPATSMGREFSPVPTIASTMEYDLGL